MKIIGVICFLVLLPFQAMSAEVYGDKSISIKVQRDVDLEKYLGLWHEVGRFENRFERDCVAATAEYSKLPNGNIRVLNTCTKKDGSKTKAKGEAWVTVPNGKLKVSFVNIPLIKNVAAGSYWIMYTDYQIAVVGNPSKKYGWILSRDPNISETDYKKALDIMSDGGYDISKITKIQ